MSEFNVEKGVPIPEAHANSGPKRYPVGEMETGDSFFVPGPKPRTQQTVQRAAYGYGKRHGMRFVTRLAVVDGVTGVRVWRVAEEPAPRPKLAAAS